MGLNKRLQVIERSEKVLQLKKIQLIEKSLGSSNPMDIIKANEILDNIQPRDKSDKKSYVIDPYEFQNSFGFKDKPYALSYHLLRNMAQTPVINAIIRTRINQVAAFAEPQRDKYSIGYKIQKKKSHENNTLEELTKEEQREVDEIYEFMENCGKGQSWEADDLDTFIRKIVRDSLTLDQSTFEVIRDGSGDLHSFLATDAATFRIAESYDDDSYAESPNRGFRSGSGERKEKIKGYYPSYVQIYQQKVTAEYYPWELSFGVRNPVSDINSNGYGISELEEMVGIITAMLWGDDYNRRFFKQGSAPKGILKVNGNVPQPKLQEFKQQWNATMRGVQNAWKTPIMEADKIEWVDLQTSNKDMEYSNWIEYLIKIGCAIYAIDPTEVNFPLQGGANDQAMFEGSGEARLKHSKDKGLYPLLKSVQKRLNKHILSQLKDGKYELVFMGLNSMSIADEHKIDTEAVTKYKTVNEVRRSRGMKDIPGGDIILDSIMAQERMAQQQQELMGQQSAGGSNEEFMEPVEEEGATPEENPFTKAFNSYISKLN